MNVVSLFTGVGGFDLGLERAGHRIVAQCEADEKARAVLRRHWPDVPIHEDVCGFDGAYCRSVGLLLANESEHDDRREPRSDSQDRERSTGPVDLVCGGFPCQDLSVAGKRAGLAGERSGLFFEAARISDAVLGGGGWVLIENVPGLLSSNGGRDFAVVLATLADLGFHDLAWRVLDSRYFGVPQRRRRVFILARRASGRRAAEVLLEPESGGGNHQASREARARVASTLSRGSSRPGVSAPGRRQEDDENLVASSLDRRQGGPDDNDAQANHLVAGALTKRYGKGINTTFDDGAMVVTDGSQREPTGRGQRDAVLPATDNGRRKTGSGSSDGQDGSVSPPPDSDGMRTPPGIPGRLDDPVYGWADELMDRPRENEIGTIRIGTTVGAPTPSLVFGQGRAAGPTSPVDPRPDGPRYAQMGNAVTVNVAQWIGERLRDFG